MLPIKKRGQHVVSVATDQTVSDGLTEDVLMGGGTTIEYSRASIIQTLFIRNLDYPNYTLFKLQKCITSGPTVHGRIAIAGI